MDHASSTTLTHDNANGSSYITVLRAVWRYFMLSLKLFRWALGSMKLVPPHSFPGGRTPPGCWQPGLP
jgi:hypothetical protein